MKIKKVLCPKCKGEVNSNLQCIVCNRELTDEEIEKILSDSYKDYKEGLK